MEVDLMSRLAEFGPWGLAVAVVVLLRKEIVAVLHAPKDDRAVEALLMEMNRQFAANMELFHVTNGHLSAVHELIGQALDVQRNMLTELVRGKK